MSVVIVCYLINVCVLGGVYMFNWEDDFDEIILERGRGYFITNYVKDCVFDELNHTISAASKGSELYQVQITLDAQNSSPVNYSCTCPYAAKNCNCKHMAAVTGERTVSQWAEAHEPSRLKWKLGGDIYADKPYTEVENPDIVSLGARERHVAVNVEGYTYASTNNVIVLEPRGKEVFRDIYVSINDQTGLTLDISDDGKQLIVKRQGQVVETYLVHDDVKQLLNANINRAKSAENNPNPEASKDNIDNLVVNYEGEDYKIIISYYDFRRDYQGLSSVTIMFDMLTK